MNTSEILRKSPMRKSLQWTTASFTHWCATHLPGLAKAVVHAGRPWWRTRGVKTLMYRKIARIQRHAACVCSSFLGRRLSLPQKNTSTISPRQACVCLSFFCRQLSQPQKKTPRRFHLVKLAFALVLLFVAFAITHLMFAFAYSCANYLMMLMIQCLFCFFSNNIFWFANP